MWPFRQLPCILEDMKQFFSTDSRAIAVRKPLFIHRFSTLLAAFTLAIMPVLAQDKPAKKVDAAVKFIPADAHMVLSINIGQLLQKSGHETFLDLPGMKEAHNELKLENEMAAKFLEKPELLGIDLDQPIHLFGSLKAADAEDEFGEPTGWGGIVATPLSAKKFEKGLRNLAKVGGDEGEQMAALLLDTMKKEGDFQILAGEGIPAAMGFSDEVIAIVGGTPDVVENAAATLMKTLKAKKNLSAAEPTFRSYLDGDIDMGGWLNISELMKLATADPEVPKDQIDQLTKILGNMRMAGALHFDPGAVSFDAFISSDAEYMKNIKPAPKKELVDLIPQKTLGSLAYSFDMEGSRKWMKEEYLPALKKMDGGEAIAVAEIAIMGMLGLNFNDLMDIPKGEFMFTFIDMEKRVDPDFGFEEPRPKLLFGMTVANQKNLKTIIDKVTEEGLIEGMGEVGFGLVTVNDRFFIGNNELLDAARLGRLPNAVKGPKRNVLTDNEVSMVIDFEQILRLAQDFDAPDEAVDVLRMFDQFQALGNMKKDLYKYQVKLLFRDKKANGLKQLINLAEKFAEQEIGLPEPDDAPALQIER